MSDQSGIEWTDATWNPVTGCTKVSPGCKNCYAERLALRLRAMGNPRYQNGFALTLHQDQLTLPLRWRQSRRIFVNSMSDLFHEAIPDGFIYQVFEVMKRADWHIFQILTKRSRRLAAIATGLSWAPHIWQGVSVENARYTSRVRDLQSVPAVVRFLSVEPLLGPIPNLPLEGIHWVIVGGESGGRRRPMAAEWARQVRDQCCAAGVPFFFKQWGGRTPKSGGRVLDGRTWDGMPRPLPGIETVVGGDPSRRGRSARTSERPLDPGEARVRQLTAEDAMSLDRPMQIDFSSVRSYRYVSSRRDAGRVRT